MPPPAALRAGEGVLVIGDRPRTADRSVQIWLVLEGDRVAFELELGNARRAGLQISARLARLARAVYE